MSHDEYIDQIKSFIETLDDETKEQLKQFCQKCTYVSGCDNGDKPYEELGKHLDGLGKGKKASQNRIFYMALPPSIFVSVSEQLKKYCYSEKAVSRLLVSVPFRR